MNGRRTGTTCFLVLLLAAGLALLAYPTVAGWWNSYRQDRAARAYGDAVSALPDGERARMAAEAAAYNARLAGIGLHGDLTEGERTEYSRLLAVDGDVMGCLEIPSIHVSLPIRHGADEAVLREAAGHVAGSSLPVGGVNTHCVLSGHRSLPGARLFRDLDKLAGGDRFSITVLDRTLVYEVDRIWVSEPSDTAGLVIEPGADLCTLVTCTPLGSNAQRLLVRGRRVEGAEALRRPAPSAEPAFIALYASAIALPLLIAWLAIADIRSRRRRAARRRKGKALRGKRKKGR